MKSVFGKRIASTLLLSSAFFFGVGQVIATAADISVTVVFKSSTLPANAAAVLTRAGTTVMATIPEIGVATVSGPASILDTLNANSDILTASPTLVTALPKERVSVMSVTRSVKVTTADLYNAYQWDIKQVTNNAASFGLGSGTHNTVVGVIDSGVSTQHPALKANLLGGRNFVPDGPNGTVVPTDIEDKNGHGSHTAGTIAGNGRILGVGPDLGFRSYRVFGATGGAPNSRISQAIVAAANDRVDVISMSIGGYDALAVYYWTDPDTGKVYKGSDVADFVAQKRALRYATGRGVVVVAAAGNEGINITDASAITDYLNAEYGEQGYVFQGASRETPGTLPGVLTVSATGPDKSLASYSNYGPGAIDVSAPGGDFQRYPVGDWYTDMCLSSYLGTGYAWMAGTSMATPKASAVAALIIDQATARGMNLLPAQVVAQMQQTSVDLGKAGYDLFYGTGMVNAYNALGGK